VPHNGPQLIFVNAATVSQTVASGAEGWRSRRSIPALANACQHLSEGVAGKMQFTKSPEPLTHENEGTVIGLRAQCMQCTRICRGKMLYTVNPALPTTSGDSPRLQVKVVPS
jgi:hypothetical protein